MEHSEGKNPDARLDRSTQARPTRREFLKLSAAAAATVAAGSSAEAMRIVTPRSRDGGNGDSANRWPGRIVLYHDPEMEGHLSYNKDRIEEVVHHGIQILTERSDTGFAFQTLFPGLHGGSTIAIKVNCLGPTDTRWEVVRGIVSGLAQMLGGTYNVSQVTIYDRHDLHAHGYDESEFTFNGHYPLISHTNAAYGSGHYVWENHQLSQYLLDANYVINVPALKSHSDPYNQITVAMKCHYGSCYPSDLCGDIPGMLALDSDENVAGKTGLVVTCGLRGTYNGGPSQPAQLWNTFEEQTPNYLFLSTDPVTNDYWARDMINSERQTHGWSDKPCPWIEEAGGYPYNLGISNPDQMQVFRLDATGVEENGRITTGATFFAGSVPNPLRDSARLRFRLAKRGPAGVLIVDPSGRAIRNLGRGDYPEGYSQIVWDGRDGQGRKVPAGVYFVRLTAGTVVRTGRIVVAR